MNSRACAPRPRRRRRARASRAWSGSPPAERVAAREARRPRTGLTKAEQGEVRFRIPRAVRLRKKGCTAGVEAPGGRGRKPIANRALAASHERNRPMSGKILLTTLGLAVCVAGLPGSSEARASKAPPPQGKRGVEKIVKNDEEWKRSLTPEQFRVLRKQGTEIAFTGKYWNHHARGLYRCAGCGLDLFDSATKFDSGTGWPSFWAPI